MDARHGLPAAGSPDADEGALAAARLQIQRLTDNGLSAETLLRALLEKCPTQVQSAGLWQQQQQQHPESCFTPSPSSPSPCASPTSTIHSSNSVSVPTTFDQTIAAAFENKTAANSVDERQSVGAKQHAPRLSVSSTRTGSTARSRASVMSSATSISSTSSQGSGMSRYSQLPGTQSFNSRPSTRAYWCTSCPQKLQRKFDWKRHEDEFHERYKKYPCPDCNRVFWGANTFNQHHKSRHNCKTCPHADKVVRYSKRKRAWGCGFCAAFLPSLERYFDHVAVHYESGKTKAHWDHALVIYGLLHQPVIHDTWKALESAKYGGLPREQRPKISWDPKNTGRSHGYLENEEPGQLQDLLEFFDPAKDNAQQIVELAWETAIQLVVSMEPQQASGVGRRPSQYIGHAQVVRPEGVKQEDLQHQQQQMQSPPEMSLPQTQRPLPRQPSIQMLPQEQQQMLEVKQEWPSSTETLAPKQDWPLTSDASSVHSIQSIPSPLPPGMQQQQHTTTAPPPSHPPPPPPSHRIDTQVSIPSDPMSLDPRPMPTDQMVLDQRGPVAFEQNFYQPVQMSGFSNPPAHPMDYTSFNGTVDFGSGLMYTGATDWNSLVAAVTAADTGMGNTSSEGQQQPQQQQQQRIPQQQGYWPNGLYPVQS
ncbi:hypothetical protein M0657_008829 [Pyricularia oryzae]|uniref:C2H2-type domain-containing protein n=3 Tax=Pyricularia oryzae TaxID=318829 RepID=A0A4P7NWV1_PYROR|nr:hypothetical protein OOU_Y34scaffold00334g9 [Pyricularia oryzae Y34]KAI7915963.1 hypothetical protein M0657_008829 [Pyricularia oryzae]QBZ66396.1 hypothetical protein PoMZ_13372 [Pyricularia oryzae]